MRKLRQGEIKELAQYFTESRTQNWLAGPPGKIWGSRESGRTPKLQLPRKPAPDSGGSAERMLAAAASTSALCRWPRLPGLGRGGGKTQSPRAPRQGKGSERAPGRGGNSPKYENLCPSLAFRERKCLGLLTVPELHFPESPRGSAEFPRIPVLRFPECSSQDRSSHPLA